MSDSEGNDSADRG